MARKHRGGGRTTLLQRVRRLRYLIVLITGGLGVGGWQLKDHPLLQQVLNSVTQADPDKPLVTTDLVKGAVQALEKHESFSEPGAFEVRVANVKIDPALIRNGQVRDVEVRVRKRDARGHESTVWDSRNAGAPAVTSRQGSPVIGWPDAPFRAEWTPGDQFHVDVWQGRGLVSTWHFEAELLQADAFPLRSGPHDLARAGQTLRPSDANQVVFDSRRVTDGDVPRTATHTQAPRDDDTIVIK